MMRRWLRVFKAVRHLIRVVGDADSDEKWTQQERSDVMTALWAVVKAYRGT